MTPLTIRPEVPADIPAIYALTFAAFGRADEPAVTDNLRAQGTLLLSLVAKRDGVVVGHVAFSPAKLVTPTRTLAPLALGPVAVQPSLQKTGIGSALIHHGLRACATLGHPIVFLLGHTTYYPRFGFKPALPLGVRWSQRPDDESHEHFMVYEHTPGDLAQLLGGESGVFSFDPAFD